MEYKSKLLVLTTIGSFMMSLDGSILNIAIFPLSSDLKLTTDVLLWIPLIYLLIMAVTLIGFGRLADLKGKTKFFLIGLIIFTGGSLLSAIASSGELLIVYRAIQATGASMVGATGIAMVTEVFPKYETGKALGINVIGIYLGLVSGPVLGGFLVQFFTWRSIFYINLPIGVCLVILGYIYLKPSEVVAKGEKFDPLGTLTFGIFLAALLLYLSLGNSLGWSNIIIISFLIIAALVFLVFIFIERSVQFPMLNLDLFRYNRVFAAANSAALMNYITTMGVGFWLAIYLQAVLKLNPLTAGLLLLPSPLCMAITSPFSGRFSDKVGSRFLCALGMGIVAVSLAILIIIILLLPDPFILLSQAIFGFGLGLFSSPNQSAIMKSVEKRQLGIASGTLSTMRVTGQSISIALLSSVLLLFITPTILNQILNAHSIPPADVPLFTSGLIAAFIVSICICITGVLLSLVRGKEELYKETSIESNEF